MESMLFNNDQVIPYIVIIYIHANNNNINELIWNHNSCSKHKQETDAVRDHT